MSVTATLPRTVRFLPDSSLRIPCFVTQTGLKEVALPQDGQIILSICIYYDLTLHTCQ